MKERLKELRKEKLNISQQEIAEKINITQASYNRYETGTTKPTNRVIADICRVYNVNREWLEHGTGEPLKVRTKKDELKEQIHKIVEQLDDEEIAILQKIAEKIKGI